MNERKQMVATKDDFDWLNRRIELLEQRLVDLATRCWEMCGTDFSKELAEEIRREKDTL